MKQPDTKPYSDHLELSQLLPWYVNQTLQGAELQAVESHLGICLTCKRELIQLQKLAQAVVKEGALDSAERASFSRLKMRLQNQPQTSQEQAQPDRHINNSAGSPGQSSPTKKQRWTGGGLPHPALAMAAALLLSVIMLAPGHIGNDSQQGNLFKTLSDGEQDSSNANEIRVVFAENVNQQQKDKTLERIHGMFVDKPTAQGVYTVKLDKDMPAKKLLDVVESLRKDTNVIFAEPAYAALSSMYPER